MTEEEVKGQQEDTIQRVWGSDETTFNARG